MKLTVLVVALASMMGALLALAAHPQREDEQQDLVSEQPILGE